jgi:hypothetical protein
LVDLMHAQVFELAGAEPSERVSRAIQGELLPALRSENGFCGALTLVRQEAGQMLLIVFWETESQAARPLVPSLVVFLEEVGAAGSTGGRPESWEVGARA